LILVSVKKICRVLSTRSVEDACFAGTIRYSHLSSGVRVYFSVPVLV
jgi:hypothetical protein